MARFDNIGRALRALRKQQCWSQRELAQHAGVTDALLCNYERGRKSPSLRNLGKILDALGLDLHQLEDELDRINERGPTHGRPEPGEPAVPGVDLARFFGVRDVPSRLQEPFAEMVQGFQSAARTVGAQMMTHGPGPRRE